ncbi:hypothetical protein K7G19_07390 [Cupriavidus sp. DB3]|uniref:hypothetical protein n=1 Tax=Cupriavidus sp. DB3 TaxID=2873259 RepID=UPI001CF3C62E|nr:hypothetical protein [Cupriavidus sp. DB3]MCA7083422.1 hypothetical protein [Cupriavidus sp. DB3]
MPTFTEHDLEHQRLKQQVFVLEHLVLVLITALAKQKCVEKGVDDEPEAIQSLARALLRRGIRNLRDLPLGEGHHPAERAMLMDESSEVFQDIEQHLEFILKGAL